LSRTGSPVCSDFLWASLSLSGEVAFFLAVRYFTHLALAGDTGHGNDPMKDRYILGRKRIVEIYKSDVLKKYFTRDERQRMVAKLLTPDPKADKKNCFEQKLCWYNTDPTNPQQPLKAELYGKPIDPILSTDPDVSALILIDIDRAKALGISDELATVSIGHEAGHAIGRSDNLEVDKIIIDYLEKHYSSRINDQAPSPKQVATVYYPSSGVNFGDLVNQYLGDQLDGSGDVNFNTNEEILKSNEAQCIISNLKARVARVSFEHRRRLKNGISICPVYECPFG